MTGAASRNRGARAERAVVNYLRTWWPDARRVLAGDGRQDCDVTFHPRVSLEVKDVAGSSWPSWCRQAVAQSKPGTIPMVVRRARGVTDVGRWVVRLPVGDLPVSGAYCPMPGVDGVWVETSLAHVVHVLLVEDGRQVEALEMSLPEEMR